MKQFCKKIIKLINFLVTFFDKRNSEKKIGKNSYLYLLYREGKGILFYQGFHRPILPTKHRERCEGGFVGRIG